MAGERLALAREWLSTALRDLNAARKLASGTDPIFENALYGCQQAAEKTVKGYLVYHDRGFQKTHDIRLLVAEASLMDDSFKDILAEAKLLTPYAMMFRYPEDGTRPTADLYEKALAAAERVYRFVLAKHPELDPEKP